ncbi:MAG: endonuclease III, partial [Firmicutes bacterium]|nr:endonuclease III [Bacillota bacterium]
MASARHREILERLRALYPNPKTALHWTTPFELLVATMLSAQSTDARVNQVTARLFPKYRTPADFAALSPEALAEEIRDVGLFRTKAAHIVEASRLILERHGGEVPGEREALEALPGVGRKTANVVLANAFGVPAIAVDTHVFRVANRLGLARARTPEETERQLMRRIPKKDWADAHHWLIYHGRRVCHARRPRCEACALADLCPSAGCADLPTGRARAP